MLFNNFSQSDEFHNLFDYLTFIKLFSIVSNHMIPIFLCVKIRGQACDIVEEAAERYKSIILKEARIGRLVSQSEGQPRTNARNSHYIGTLQALNITFSNNCDLEYWPYLYMNESCKLRYRTNTKHLFARMNIRKIIKMTVNNKAALDGRMI